MYAQKRQLHMNGKSWEISMWDWTNVWTRQSLVHQGLIFCHEKMLTLWRGCHFSRHTSIGENGKILQQRNMKLFLQILQQIKMKFACFLFWYFLDPLLETLDLAGWIQVWMRIWQLLQKKTNRTRTRTLDQVMMKFHCHNCQEKVWEHYLNNTDH